MKTYTVAAPAMTAEEAAQSFFKVLGRQIRVEKVSYDQARTSLLSLGLWEWAVDGMLEYYRLVDCDSPCALVRHSHFQVCVPTRLHTIASA